MVRSDPALKEILALWNWTPSARVSSYGETIAYHQKGHLTGGGKMDRYGSDLKEIYGRLLRLSLLLALCIYLVGFLAKQDMGLHPVALDPIKTDTLWIFPEEPPPDIEEPPPVQRPKPEITPAEPDDPDAVETIITDSEAWSQPPHIDLPVPKFTEVYEEKPVPIFKAKPIYPPLAKLGKLEGRVYVIAYIDATGRVVKAEIGISAHESLDRAALESVRQWRFKPARMRDKPVAVKVGIPIDFKLR
jgi:protein TonB